MEQLAKSMSAGCTETMVKVVSGGEPASYLVFDKKICAPSEIHRNGRRIDIIARDILDGRDGSTA